MAYTDQLVAAWGLNSNAWLDDSGNNHTLTAVGIPTNATGKIGNCVSLNGSSQALYVADHADFSAGSGVELTMSLWVKLNSKAADMTLISKQTGNGAATQEYRLYYRKVSDAFRFEVSNGTTMQGITDSVFITSPSIGTWYFIMCGFLLSSPGIVETQFKPNCASVTASASDNGYAPVRDGTGKLVLGAEESGGGYANWLDGFIDGVFFWRRSPVSVAADGCPTVYNSGNGFEMPSTGGGGGGGDAVCVGSIPQLWALTQTTRKITRVQVASTRDMLLGTDLTTGSAKPNWAFSTGFERPGKSSRVTHLLADTTGGPVDLFPSKSMDTSEERRISVPVGEIHTEGAGDMASPKWRIRAEGTPEAKLRTLMWERDGLDRTR